MVAPDGIRKPSRMAHAEPRQSYGPSSGPPNLRGLDSTTGLVGKLVCPTLIRERSVKVGRPGRSVAASASALGAEDRRFESCRPDTVIQSTALAPEDHHGNAGVAQWQSPSLPSWSCEFDSRHPLQWHNPLSGAISRSVIERGGGGIRSRQAGHLGPIMRCAGADLPSQEALRGRTSGLLGDHQPNSRATHGPQPSMTVRNEAFK
jgi:hypothetical protein